MVHQMLDLNIYISDQRDRDAGRLLENHLKHIFILSKFIYDAYTISNIATKNFFFHGALKQ